MRLSNYSSWIRNSLFAVTDQALFAGSAFLLNVLLGRWLSPTDYGSFTIAYSVLILVGALHTAFLTEPMLIFSRTKYNNQFKDYIATLITGHWLTVTLLCMVMGITSISFSYAGLNNLSHALFGALLATPFFLLLWLLRRAFYALDKPSIAALGSALLTILLCAGLLITKHYDVLNTFVAFIIIGGASLLISVWNIYILKPGLINRNRDINKYEVAKNHLNYGKWAGLTAILIWFPSNVYFYVLPLWHDIESSAGLKAILNLIMPALQINTALSLLILVKFSTLYSENGISSLLKPIKIAILIFVAFSVSYWIFFVTFNHELLKLVYGEKYVSHATALAILGLLPIFSAVTMVYGCALRAMHKPEIIFYTYVIATVVSLILAITLSYRFGVTGAAIGMLISYMTAALVIYIYYIRVLNEEELDASLSS